MDVVTLFCEDDEAVVGVFSTPDKAINRALGKLAGLPGDERRLIAQEVLQTGQARMYVAASPTPNYRLTLFGVDAWY